MLPRTWTSLVLVLTHFLVIRLMMNPWGGGFTLFGCCSCTPCIVLPPLPVFALAVVWCHLACQGQDRNNLKLIRQPLNAPSPCSLSIVLFCFHPVNLGFWADCCGGRIGNRGMRLQFNYATLCAQTWVLWWVCLIQTQNLRLAQEMSFWLCVTFCQWTEIVHQKSSKEFMHGWIILFVLFNFPLVRTVAFYYCAFVNENRSCI